MKTKLCGGCKTEKSEGEFYRVKITRKTSKDGLSGQCKSCQKGKASAWNKANKERHREHHRRWFAKNGEAYYAKHAERQSAAVWRCSLKRKYGISVERYHELYVAQDGKCAICREACQRGKLSVDHSHADGRVRGLLCRPCNTGIGGFRDRTDLLEAGIEYLKVHRD